MSKKRTTDESNDDDLTNDGTGCSAKRARPDPTNDRSTTLQDLPKELLQRILVRAIVSEVEDLKLAKCVWKEKADPVIERLRVVSSQWNDLLTTNSFRNELHRTLDGTAQKSIRLEVLRESRVQSSVRAMTVLGDEIFAIGTLFDQQHVIIVYSRNDPTEVRNVISLGLSTDLRGPYPYGISGCKVSNCVYLRLIDSPKDTVKRIAKAEGHPLQFNVSPWLSDHRWSIINVMSVSENGSLLILSEKRRKDPNVISIYDTNGCLQREIMFTTDEKLHGVSNVLQKSNGNVVVACLKGKDYRVSLLEVDGRGRVVRQHKSTRNKERKENFADSSGRIVRVIGLDSEIELLDSEFNLLGVYDLPPDEGSCRLFIKDVHYDSTRNEIVLFKKELFNMSMNNTCSFTFFRFAEE